MNNDEKNPAPLSGLAPSSVFPGEDAMTDRKRIEDWLNGLLSPEEADELEEAVDRPGPWRDLYNRVLSEDPGKPGQPRRLPFVRYRRQDTLRVAVDRYEIDQAKEMFGCVYCLLIPHEGPDARLEAVVTPDGLLFHTVNAGERRVRLCPFDAKEFRWRDRALDVKVVLVEMPQPPPFDRALQAATEIGRLAYGAGHCRALELAINVTDDLKGIWLDILGSAEHAFEEGIEDPDDISFKLLRLVQLRDDLHRLARRLGDAYLDVLLKEADDLLERHKSGLLLQSSFDYDRYMEWDRIDYGVWWTYPAQLDRAVPTHLVEEALQELAKERHGSMKRGL